MIPSSIDCNIDKIKLNNNAGIKPFTWKPVTILPHNIIINAFITNKNKPKVKIFMGIAINCRIGFTKKFKTANTITTTIDEPKPSTLTPGKKYDSKDTMIAVAINFIITFIYLFN